MFLFTISVQHIHEEIVQIRDEPTVYQIQARQLGDSRSAAPARGVKVFDRTRRGGWLEGHQQDAGEQHMLCTYFPTINQSLSPLMCRL